MNESGSDGREVLREKEERGGSVSERSILRRAEVFDQTDSVICFFFFIRDKFSFVRCIVVV